GDRGVDEGELGARFVGDAATVGPRRQLAGSLVVADNRTGEGQRPPVVDTAAGCLRLRAGSMRADRPHARHRRRWRRAVAGYRSVADRDLRPGRTVRAGQHLDAATERGGFLVARAAARDVWTALTGAIGAGVAA